MRYTTQPTKLDRSRHLRTSTSNSALSYFLSSSTSSATSTTRSPVNGGVRIGGAAGGIAATPFSTIRSILSIVFILITLSFLTVSLNGNAPSARRHSSTTLETNTQSQQQQQRQTLSSSAIEEDSSNSISSSDSNNDRVTAFAEAVPLVEKSVTDSSITKVEADLVKQASAPQPVAKPAVADVVKTSSTSATSNSAAMESERTSSSSNDNMMGPTVPLVEGSRVERRSKAKTFMVIFMGHSGSTAFITELRNHPDFEVEKLEPVDHGEYETNTDLALKHARELLDRGLAKGKIPGFKVRPYHIRKKPKAWEDLVREYDTRIFWQFRVNIMKQAVGEYRHRVLNDTSVVEGLKASETACDKSSGYQCQFRVDDVAALHDLLNDFTMNDDILGEAVRMLKRDDHMLAVKYEDYLYRRNETMKETLDFLGVDQMETEPQRAKASPDSLCHMVTNYQEVCRAFYPCQLWRPYLDDDRNNCYCRPSNGGEFQQRFCHRAAWYQKK